MNQQTTKTTPIISFRDVQVAFGSFIVHKSISFDIYPGEVVTILGPSGAGKTIILKLIMGLLTPTRGSVRVMDQEVSDLNDKQIQELRAHIGMLFQGAALFDSLSVFENIAYGLRERGEKSEERLNKIVADRLSIVGLSGIEKKFPPQLSGGQKKRVGLARALATSPEIMLFDEPTTGLDPTSTRMIDDLILKLKDEHRITSIAVTHDIPSARRFSDRWLLVKDGIIAADGAVERVANENQLVSSFIRGEWRDDL